jgi:hypothetical protein
MPWQAVVGDSCVTTIAYHEFSYEYMTSLGSVLVSAVDTESKPELLLPVVAREGMSYRLFSPMFKKLLSFVIAPGL